MANRKGTATMRVAALMVLIVVSLMDLSEAKRWRPSAMHLWRFDNETIIEEPKPNQTESVAEHVNVVEGNATQPIGDGGALEGTLEQCRNGVNRPSSTNCSTFLVCNEGVETEGFCPPDFWYDPNHKGDMLCNHPEIVCAADQGVCDCASQYPVLAPDPLIEQDVTCMADNRFHFTSSRVDCGRYFVCFNGNVRRMECKAGFQFDPKTELCDYPEMVNCKIIDPQCPVNGVGFLAHPNRPDAFYFCFYGYKTIQSCSFFHVWDSTSNSCRRRDDMNMI